MKRTTKLAMAIALAVTSTSAAAQDAAGDWNGMLGEGPGALRVVVHVARDAEGALGGTLDSPDQNARGIPLAEVTAGDGQFSFTVPAVGGKYKATWDEGSGQWKGTWEQNLGPTPLDLSAGLPSGAPLPVDWQAPADPAIRQLIADRIAPRAGEGIAVGVLEPQGTRIVSSGPVEASTLFEIGSISKVFTALILADMAAKGEISLDDPAEKYLPAGAHMPERGGRKITLRDLSMHRSGLPRLPDNMPYGDPDDPYADYTEAQMLEFLGRYALPRDIGAQWEYSNFGVGLLGYLLGRAAHEDYETLLRERITGPLGMADTAVSLSPQQTARLATPHDQFGRPAKPWNLPTLMGAGGIRSTAPDMLKFAAAVLDPSSPLGPAMKLALSELGDTGSSRVRQALGWQVVTPEPGREVLMHDGGTGGFRSSLVLEPAEQRAVVVLANSGAEPSTNDLAVHILLGTPVAPTPPLPPAPVTRAEVTLPAAELERVVGLYDFAAGVVFNVIRDGDVLRAQREGAVTGPVLQIFPEAPLKFFWKAVDAQVRFIADESGKVTGAEFSQGGQTLTGKRIEP
jgi:CubicO group peptidase (beta-lactamase class C family)